MLFWKDGWRDGWINQLMDDGWMDVGLMVELMAMTIDYGY